MLQRCYDYSSTQQKNALSHRITEYTNIFVRDQYGNYVIQFVLNLEGPSFQNFKDEIGNSIIKELIELSKQKFSSNVIEKCIAIRFTYFKLIFRLVIKK